MKIEKVLDYNAVLSMIEANDRYAIRDYLIDNGFENYADSLVDYLFSVSRNSLGEAVTRLNNYWEASGGASDVKEVPVPPWEEWKTPTGSWEYFLTSPNNTQFMICLSSQNPFSLRYNPEVSEDQWALNIQGPSGWDWEIILEGSFEECRNRAETMFYNEVFEINPFN